MTPDERELVRLWKWAALLSHQHCRPHPCYRLTWFAQIGDVGVRFTPESGEVPMFTIPIGKRLRLSLIVTDLAGNPARVDPAGTTAAVAPAEFGSVEVVDATTLLVRLAGPLIPGQLNGSIDADLGEGVKAIPFVADLQAEAGMAAAVVVGGTLEDDV